MKILLVVDVRTDGPLQNLRFGAGLLQYHLLENLGHGCPVGLYGADPRGTVHVGGWDGGRADATQRLK